MNTNRNGGTWLYLTIVVAVVLLNGFCIGKALAQDGGDAKPEVSRLWLTIIDFAGVDMDTLQVKVPSFPKTADNEAFEQWLEKMPADAEVALSIINQRGVYPSRGQLGLDDDPMTYATLLSSTWGNAISTYRSEKSVKSNLPHIPNPQDFCTVSGYKKDISNQQSWRAEAGYGPNANDELDLSKAPDPNDLFDSNKYPCLAPYYNAIDRWVYEYPEEYHKWLKDCGCGEDAQNGFLPMPDSIRPPYMPPMQRMKEANDYTPPAAALDEMDTIYFTEQNPLELMTPVIGVSVADLERVIEESGFMSFREELQQQLSDEQLSQVLPSYAFWARQNKNEVYEKLKADAAKDGSTDFFSQLEAGIIPAVKVTEIQFRETLKRHTR